MNTLLVLLSVWSVGSSFIISRPDGDSGKPLFLSPYIKAGNIEEGRNAARSNPFFGDIESYSGFLTVNETYNGNMFFWYFPAEEEQNDGKPAPVVIWLQGGPGETSLFGLFFEHGPLVLNENFTMAKRQCRWSRHNHMIYIDNPVGAGFSFSNRKGYNENEDEVSNNLYELLIQFFQLFPHLATNEFFVAGESYAGQYVPAISHKIHKENPTAKLKINLKGLAIGDGVYDGWNKQIRNAFQMGAIVLMDEYFSSRNSTSVRQNIHAGSLNFSAFNQDIFYDLIYDDELIAPVIEDLLQHYRVIYYNGVNDDVIYHKGTENFLQNLKWSGSSNYRKAATVPWNVDNEDAGSVRSASSLTYVLFNDAGHTVPADQPQRAFEMITKFIRNEPLV